MPKMCCCICCCCINFALDCQQRQQLSVKECTVKSSDHFTVWSPDMIWFWFSLHEHWPVYLPGLSPQVWSLVSCFCMNSCFSSFCSIFLQEKVEAQTGCQLVRLHPVDGRILPGYPGLRVSAMVALPGPGDLAWGDLSVSMCHSVSW